MKKKVNPEDSINQSLLSKGTVNPHVIQVFGKNIPVNIALAVWTIISIIAGIVQQLSMPIAIFTLGGSIGAYPILFICALSFNLVFWPIAIYRHFKDRSRQKQEKGKVETNFLLHNFSWKLILIGVLDGSNGFLAVFSSSPTRVPPLLQPILGQSFLIFILLCSKYMLGRKYGWRQIISMGVVFFGILVSLIPVFIQIAQNQGGLEFESGFYWGIIMIIAMAPGAAMNVVEEEVFDKQPAYDVVLLIAWESLFQLIFIMGCFWVDIIPGFGTSSSLQSMMDNFGTGLSCLFDQTQLPEAYCGLSLIFLGLFALAYCANFYFSGLLFKYASANYNAAVSSVTSPGSTLFWCIFPGVNRWVQGPPTTLMDIITSVLSFVFIIPASWYFKKFDMMDRERQHPKKSLVKV